MAEQSRPNSTEKSLNKPKLKTMKHNRSCAELKNKVKVKISYNGNSTRNLASKDCKPMQQP